MAYASITYTSASGTTFALTNSNGDPIEYLRQADISVTVNGVLKTQGTDYTFNSAGTAIVLGTAVSGATVVISRTTEIADATVNFTAGSTLTAQDLNNSDKQYRFALQEFSDLYDPLRTGTGDLGDLGGFIDSGETWVSDNGHAPTTAAVDARVDSKIDTALTTDVVAGDAITITDNSPSSGQITVGVTNASISTAKLVDSSVTTAKIADGNVTTAKIFDANVTTAKLADSNVTTAKIADSAITTAKIADGAVSEIKLATDAVTTAKILDSNVTTGKLANNAVTTAKLADSSVTSAKIVDGTIVADDLASDSVTTAKIVDSNVTTAKINDSAVTTGKIADSAVTAAKIADNVITSAKINAGTIITAAEQSSCVPDDVTFFTTSATDGRYVNVTGDSMTGALAMGSNKITNLATPTVSTDAASKGYVDGLIASASIPDADYGDITVSGSGTSWIIDNGVVTSAKIADGTIVNADINASAAIAKTKISGTAITAADVGTVDSTIIADGSITNTKVSASAAIDGTKISPDFGSQNVVTTGTSTAGSFTPTSSTVPGDGIYLPAANSIAIATNGSNRFHITSGGLVGIGTSSPDAKLEVVDTASSLTYPIAVSNFTDPATDVGAAVDFRLTTGGNSRGYIACRYTSNSSTDGTYLSFAPNDGSTGNVERMRITKAGLVGIGTTTVNSLLEVRGTTDGQNVLHLSNNAGAGDGQAENQIRVTCNGNTNWGNLDIQAYQTIFTQNGGEKARIDANGRLLVGTSTSASTANGFTPSVQVAGAGALAAISAGRYAANANPPQVVLQKSRNATIGAHTVVNSGDEVGAVSFEGSDGTGFIQAALISAYVDGTPGTNDMPGRLVFSTTADGASTPTARITIDSSGRVLVGTSTARSNFFNTTSLSGNLQLEGSTDTTRLISHVYSQNSADDPFLVFGKTRSTTIGGNTIVQSGDFLGGIAFQGSDGTELVSAVEIRAAVDGTPGANDMPGCLLFSTTADGASSPSERMRIDSSGRVGIGTSNPRNPVHLFGNGQTTAFLSDSGNRGSCLRVSQSGADSGSGGSILFANEQGDTANSLGFAAIKGLLRDGSSNTSGEIAFSVRNGATETSLTEHMRISGVGGSGTTIIYNQSEPSSKSAAATLTAGELLSGIVRYTGAAAALTLPTGTNCDAGAGIALYNNMTFQWSVINTGSGTCTIGAATGHTIVGVATVAASNAGRFATRRTGTNTWVTYRLSS